MKRITIAASLLASGALLLGGAALHRSGGPWWDALPLPTLDPAASTHFTQGTALALLPRAASVSPADEIAMFENLMAADGRFRSAHFPNQALSAVVRCLDRDFSADYEDDCGYLHEWQKAALSADESYLSVLQPQNIVHVECSDAGGVASGSVRYEGTMFRGQAEFTARRRNGYWEVDSFTLPRTGVQIRRGPDGVWRRADPFGELFFLWPRNRLNNLPAAADPLAPGGV